MNEELAKKYLEALFEEFEERQDGWYFQTEMNELPVDEPTQSTLLDEIAEYLYHGEAEPLEE